MGRPSNEERVLDAIAQLTGAATPKRIAEKLGWDSTDPGTLKRVGLIASPLVQRRIIERKAETVYEFPTSRKPSLVHP